MIIVGRHDILILGKKVLLWGEPMRKQKLTIDGQIEHMKNKKGILFSIVNEDEAKGFLTNNNYYFKIKSYAKNYEKHIGGKNHDKYIDLEFAYLQEMSTIDMYFRRMILKLTLDTEHFLKTQLIRDFSMNNEENGYDIIDELFSRYPRAKENLESKARVKNSACYDLITKYSREEFAIWNIVEVLSFGDFTKLYRMYYQKYETKGSMEKHLWSVNFLRNAAAHNNCLLNSLRTPYSKEIIPNERVMNFLSKIDGVSREARRNKMKNPVIHDFVVTLFVFYNVATSKGIRKHTIAELKDLMDNRMLKHRNFFEDNQLIVSYHVFVKKIIDYFYGFCI